MNHSFLFLVKRIPGISGGNISIYTRIPDRPSREREHSSAALPEFPHAETSQFYIYIYISFVQREEEEEVGKYLESCARHGWVEIDSSYPKKASSVAGIWLEIGSAS